MTSYRAHSVVREDRPDGAILLRSGYDLPTPAARTTDWLRHWAAKTPQAVFLGERSGAGWREVTYAEALAQVEALAQSLIGRGFGANTPVLVISGNSVNHGLLALACQMVGVPVVPVAEQYALIPAAHVQLDHIARLTRPAMVYAEDAERLAEALALPVLEGCEKLAGRNAGPGMTAWETLLAGDTGTDLAAREASVGPESVVKILMTSGSTSLPKGVQTTHGMMCSNMAMINTVMPFLQDHPPRLVDWLPWNHVFGGSHNFNMVLSNGGSLHVDAGKPVRPLIDQTIANLREKSATIAFNVPVGFAFLRDAMREDAALRESYFRDLDMLFYAGASLPRDIWDDLHAMAVEVRGDAPMFTSSWGLTETAPAALSQYQRSETSGVVGVPLPGTETKLLLLEENRFEIRTKGPNIFTGYLRDPAKTEEAFDDEGFFVTGDAMRFVDPQDPSQGLMFDGRLSEDFKLITGTWVRAAALRLELLVELAPLAADLVVCGADKDQVGLLVLPSPEARALADEATGEAIFGPTLTAEINARLAPRLAKGSAARVMRVRVLQEPASLPHGEITAKGNLNFRKLLQLRANSLDLLYSEDPATIRIEAR